MPLAKRSAAYTLALLLLLVPGGLVVIGLIWVYRKLRDRAWLVTPAA